MTTGVEELTGRQREAAQASASHVLLRDNGTSTPPGGPGVTDIVEDISTASAGVAPGATALAAFCSTSAAAWMMGGIYRDFLAHGVALLGAVFGVGIVALAYRTRRGRGLQYLVIPVAVLVGAILVAPDARGGSASLPGLVVDAMRSGGLLQPPVSFDPGWRMILVVIFALLGAGATSAAISLRRPKLAVLIPVPVTIGAAFIQPADVETLQTVVSLVLIVGGLAIAYGAELGSQGALGAGFESRRLLRSAAMAGGIAIVVALLSSFGALFPQPQHNRVVPPQRPQVAAAEPDRILFTYTASRPVPLRLGVIDTYDVKAGAWELPEYDTTRLIRLRLPAAVPKAKRPTGQSAVTASFHIFDIRGHDIPSIAGVVRLNSSDHDIVDYDPRTQAIRLADRPAFNGLKYSEVAASIPTGKELADAGDPGKNIDGAGHCFCEAPSPPPRVLSVLANYSQEALKLNVAEDAFDRLQFARQALYDNVVAAGPGKPVDVSASRVVQMLNGGDASPYEITAAEALLARWSGVPARIGYGYYGGAKHGDGTYEIHPKDGSTWLEVYFKGYGWVPLTGVPPKAKPSTSQEQKNEQPIQVSDQLAVIVYIPIRYQTVKLLYEYVRYWLVYVAPYLIVTIALIVAYPWLFKLARTQRRRRWGRKRGLKERIAVAYAEFRDIARDLAVGDPAATPVAFVDFIDSDAEHEELAWLVTRALWGDMRRDLRGEDVESAERLAASVAKRVRRAQPGLSQILAAVARTSLREPYSRQVPNLWVEFGWLTHPTRWAAMRRRLRRRPQRLQRAIPLGAALLLVSMVLPSCGPVSRVGQRTLPRNLVPASFGALRFQREPKAEVAYAHAGPDALVSQGMVYTVRHDDFVDGTVQVSLFKPEVDTSDLTDRYSDYCISKPEECTGHEAFKLVQKSLGAGRFHRLAYDGEREYVMQLIDQRIYVWFPARTETMVLLILRNQFTAGASDALFHALIDFENNKSPAPISLPGGGVANATASG